MTQRSIAGLRVYQQALKAEGSVYELVKRLPAAQFFDLGNDLRRAGSAVAHHVAEAHRQYSYQLKLDELHAARTAAEDAVRLLADFEQRGFGKTAGLRDEYQGVIKQSWGLIRYLKKKQAERATQAQVAAADELIAARR